MNRRGVSTVIIGMVLGVALVVVMLLIMNQGKDGADNTVNGARSCEFIGQAEGAGQCFATDECTDKEGNKVDPEYGPWRLAIIGECADESQYCCVSKRSEA